VAVLTIATAAQAPPARNHSPNNEEDFRLLNRRRFALAAPAALLAACALSACQDKPEAAAPAPAAQIPAQDLYALAAKGNGFTVGPVMAAHTVYVFFDPACPHCAHLWGEAKPLAGKLKIVWMPIALLRNTSGPQGATILGAPNPAEAMEQNEASVLAHGPGIAVPASLPDELLAKVKANTELFNKAGAESVPFIVFRNAKSGQAGTHAGAVSTAELAAMAGI
jgi:thiol:disulfide interchange protein DsbG